MSIFKAITENKAKLHIGLLPDGFLQLTVTNAGKISQSQVNPADIEKANAEFESNCIKALMNANIRKAAENPVSPEGTEDIAG